jgi:DNA polymerase-1
MTLREAMLILKPMFENAAILKVGHNVKFAALALSLLGQRDGVFGASGVSLQSYDDAMLISYALNGGAEAHHDLPHLADRWLGRQIASRKETLGKSAFDLVDIERAAPAAAELADVALRLWAVMKPMMVAKGLVSVYERLERPMVPVLAGMERRGVTVDRQILSRLSGDLAQTAARLEDEIYEAAGERFTIGSPKQLGDILFGRMGLPAAQKQGPVNGRPRRRSWRISLPKDTCYRVGLSTGARSPSSNLLILMRCPATSIPIRVGFIPIMLWRRQRRATVVG